MAIHPVGLQPLDRALREVGDRWTLLVIAALADGDRRFNELHEQLVGIAPNILSRRLRDLEAAGLVVAEPYQRRPLRMAYRLTASGAELAGVLTQLAAWGSGRGGLGPPTGSGDGTVRHQVCGTPLETRWWCPTCERPADPNDVDELHQM